MQLPKMVDFVVKRYAAEYAKPKNGDMQYARQK